MNPAHIAADGGQYLYCDCLRRAKRPARARPLPGVLDRRTFEQARGKLGRCDICGAGKAVYRSREARVMMWYARLVREGNRGEGGGEKCREQRG